MLKHSHITHYILLAVGLCVAFGFVFLLRYSPSYQFYAVVSGVLFYLSWGIIHHYIEGRLSLHIFGEYALIGALVTLLFAMMLKLF